MATASLDGSLYTLFVEKVPCGGPSEDAAGLVRVLRWDLYDGDPGTAPEDALYTS